MDIQAHEAELIQLVRDHNFEQTLNRLKFLSFKEIQELCWELLPLVISATDEFLLKEEESTQEDDFNKLIDEILVTLSAGFPPKEVLLMYLESLPTTKSLYVFDLILENVSGCFKKQVNYSKASFIWAIELISDSLQWLPSPQESNFDNAEERKLMDMDADVRAIIDRLCSVLNFLKTQFKHLEDRGLKPFDERDRLQLCSHIVQPFRTTLGLLDLCPSEKGKSPSAQHVQAIRFVGIISKISDPLVVLELAECRRPTSKEDELKVNSLSAGVLAYMVFCLSKSFPRVYSPITIADLLFTLSLNLLSSTRTLHVLKGFDLLEEALVYVDCVNKSDSLHLSTLRLLKTLFQIMTECSVKEARERALRTWTQLFKKCHSDAQPELLHCLFKASGNSSVRGYILDTWRNHLVQTNQGNATEIVQKLIFLPGGETTDLLDHSEYLLASLNLLRYLYLKRMIEKLPALDSYLSTFKKALQLSRAHFELRLSADEGDQSVSLIPNVPRDMEKDVLRQALTRFDLMENLLGIVQSLYDAM